MHLPDSQIPQLSPSVELDVSFCFVNSLHCASNCGAEPRDPGDEITAVAASRPRTNDAAAAAAARRFQGRAGALLRSVCSDSTSAVVVIAMMFTCVESRVSMSHMYRLTRRRRAGAVCEGVQGFAARGCGHWAAGAVALVAWWGGAGGGRSHVTFACSIVLST